MSFRDDLEWGADVAELVRAKKLENYKAGNAKSPNRNWARGERAGAAKLSATAVGEIREARARGETFTSIATRYSVCKSTIQYAVQRGWKHI